MPSYPQPIQGDQPVVMELDAGFRGVNQRAERGQLQPGYVWEAVNVRMDEQQVKTRPGSLLSIHFNHVQRDSIQGAGIYNDAAGREWMVICEPRRVWLCADGWQPLEIAIPAGQALAAATGVIQCGRELRLLRGVDTITLTWDGDLTQPLFRPLPLPTGPTFLERQPNASWAVMMADRLWVPISSDEIAWSDLLEYNAFDPTLASVRFNRVVNDSLVTAAPYDQQRMVVFGSRSIYVLSNVVGDLSAMRQDDVTASLGCLARRSVVSLGEDVFYLARGGLYSLRDTEQAARLQGVPIPVSYPVRHWMDRINWDAAADACACVCGEYYLLSVPVDGSTRNNAVLAFHLPTKEWHSMDFYGQPPPATSIYETLDSELCGCDPINGPALALNSEVPDIVLSRAQAFVMTNLFGQHTAFLVDGQRVIALGHGSIDRLENERQIVSRIETRGYGLGELLSKRFNRLVLAYDTRNASLSLTATTDGVREDMTVFSAKTRDRRKWLRLGKKPFEVSNPDGRFTDAYREDYTWFAGDNLTLRERGVRIGDLQSYEQAVPLRRQGRWMAATLENTRGTMCLISVVAEGLASTGGPRSKT